MDMDMDMVDMNGRVPCRHDSEPTLQPPGERDADEATRTIVPPSVQPPLSIERRRRRACVVDDTDYWIGTTTSWNCRLRRIHRHDGAEALHPAAGIAQLPLRLHYKRRRG